MNIKVYNYNWDLIQKDHDNTGSITFIMNKYKLSRKVIETAINYGLFKKNIKDTNILKKQKENFRKYELNI